MSLPAIRKPSRPSRLFALTTVVSTTLAAVAVTLAGPAASATTALEQHIGLPAYIPPSNTATWNRISTAGSSLGFVIANVANGPGSATADASWTSVISATHQNGTKVLGYVDTGYFGTTSPARLTRLGESTKTAWLVQAEQDIDRWYNLYGGSLDGIFFDDGQNVCGPTSSSTEYVDLYSQLNDYVHHNHRGSFTVMNPGVAVPECYEDTADVLLTFEGNYTDFMATTRPAGYATAQWQLDADPNKFLELVYDVPNQASMTAAIARSKQDNAGYVYITPLTLAGNPWLDLPPADYWTAELAASQVTDTATPATPTAPRAASKTGTSVSLAWTSSTSENVAGYDVYLGTAKIASVANFTPDDTTFTVTGLAPSTAYSFTVRARHYAGAISSASPALSVTTSAKGATAPSAPGGLTATNVAATSTNLAWNASTAGSASLSKYDVYQDGALILTVPSTIRAVHVGDMNPGTQHSFTVKARDTSGSVSAASTAVSVTTTNPTPVTNPTVTYTSTTATFSAQYNLPFTFQHVFIDTDGVATTGYPIGGIGSEFMIETSGATASLYSKTGTPANWTWTWVSAGTPLVSSVNGLYIWSVPTSTLGAPATLTTVFNGSGSWPDYTTAAVVATK